LSTLSNADKRQFDFSLDCVWQKIPTGVHMLSGNVDKSPTIRDLGKKLSDQQSKTIEKPRPEGRPFVRDLAQDATIDQWKKRRDPVEVTLITGIVLTGTLVRVGVYSIYLQSAGRDLLIFKTGIISISGPNAYNPVEKTSSGEVQVL
jgi:sRNA-binding regulator protein Hfq